jgi:hypothetical protein
VTRPHALWWAAPLVVGLCDRRPAASRATHPRITGPIAYALLALRKALHGVAPPLVRVEGQTLALDPAGVEVDVATFAPERRVIYGGRSVARGGGARQENALSCPRQQ